MLVVEEATLPNEDALLAQKRAFNANEFVWQHGMTPPLRHVRKRRFRKRLNRQVRRHSLALVWWCLTIL